MYYSPVARHRAKGRWVPWRWPRAINESARSGENIAWLAHMVVYENCLCSPCTPRLPALGIPRARDPAGGNRAVRGAEYIHHANVNLDEPRPRNMRGGQMALAAVDTRPRSGTVSCL